MAFIPSTSTHYVVFTQPSPYPSVERQTLPFRVACIGSRARHPGNPLIQIRNDDCSMNFNHPHCTTGSHVKYIRPLRVPRRHRQSRSIHWDSLLKSLSTCELYRVIINWINWSSWSNSAHLTTSVGEFQATAKSQWPRGRGLNRHCRFWARCPVCSGVTLKLTTINAGIFLTNS